MCIFNHTLLGLKYHRSHIAKVPKGRDNIAYGFNHRNDFVCEIAPMGLWKPYLKTVIRVEKTLIWVCFKMQNHCIFASEKIRTGIRKDIDKLAKNTNRLAKRYKQTGEQTDFVSDCDKDDYAIVPIWRFKSAYLGMRKSLFDHPKEPISHPQRAYFASPSKRIGNQKDTNLLSKQQ